MNCNYRLTVAVLLICLASCGEPPQNDLTTDEFILQEGFEIELVANEPLLSSPMAMTFDWEGRIWVVELPGYMRDINGSEEDFPDGKIAILEDQDQDGRMDTRKVFLDSLVEPRALSFAYGGLLYTETPNLWWVPIEGDQAGERVLVDSAYVIGGNIEHQPNTLLYNLDNWFYSAKSNVRYQRKNGVWIKETTTFRGQWGLSHDDEGRLFYNSNSNPIQGDFTFPNQFIDNPFHKASIGVKQTLSQNHQVYPIQATAVNRGYVEGNLDEQGRLKTFTSACGPLIYRGHQFPADFHGNYFVCGPEVNLVKRYILEADQGRITARQAYQAEEFLVSKEETFRPVNLYNGPDGTLYILDLRKGVIQHRAYMSSYLRDQALERGLDQVNGLGRIYKVRSTTEPIDALPDFASFSTQDYVQLLQDDNGKLRSMAQQYLVFGDHRTTLAELEAISLDTDKPLGQIQALWTIEGLGELTPAMLAKVAAKSTDPTVIIQLLRLADPFAEADELWPLFQKATSLSAAVDLQLCHALGKRENPEARTLWRELAKTYQSDPLYSEALISGLSMHDASLIELITRGEIKDTLSGMLMLALDNQKNNKIEAPQFRTQEFQDNRTKGAQLYSTYCGACHGHDGKGIDQLAPPLYNSEYVNESSEKLILIALHGLQGPLTVDGKRYDLNLVMPGVKNNPALSDEDIAHILRFIGNAYNRPKERVKVEQVSKIRQMTRNQQDLFTDESLEEWLKANLDEHGNLPEM